MSKYIFLDVDGTLVTYENHLPDSAVKAIKAAQAKGHKVYTVTGRSKAEMYQEIQDIGFDGYIGGNGNYIESDSDVLAHRTLTAEDTNRIVNWLHEHLGLELYLEANSGLYASGKFEERGLQTMKDYIAYKGKEDNSMTVRKAFPEMLFGESLERSDINKVSFILDSYQDFREFAKAEFSDFKVGTWGGRGEKALFGDIALAGINKQTALDFLLKEKGVDRQDTFAFGDANIDIPMLEFCGVGVAMGSGGDGIKAMADYVTDATEDDGLYNAFKHFDLI